MERTQWLLYFSVGNFALLCVVVWMLLSYKRRDVKIDQHIENVYKHVTGLPQGDIGTILDHLALVMASLATTRVDAVETAEAIRRHISSNSDQSRDRELNAVQLLAWIKDRMEKFFR